MLVVPTMLLVPALLAVSVPMGSRRSLFGSGSGRRESRHRCYLSNRRTRVGGMITRHVDMGRHACRYQGDEGD